MTNSVSIRSLITPHDQTLRIVFSAQRSYFIDIYQREYKWKAENVETLLNDIEVRFSQHAPTKTDPTAIQAEVLEGFEPYFLNTYLTSTSATTTSIVDGQQRLTTLLLILINKFFKQFGLPLTIFCLFAGVSDAPRRLKNPGESYAESTSAD